MHWYFEVLGKYFEFGGRARRAEYWMYTLFTLLISLFLALVDEVAGLNKATGGLSPLYTLYGLAVFIPGLAVSVRRLHDIGKSGWWLLLVFVPLVGVIVLLMFHACEGDTGPNEYGPDPKSARDGVSRPAREVTLPVVEVREIVGGWVVLECAIGGAEVPELRGDERVAVRRADGAVIDAHIEGEERHVRTRRPGRVAFTLARVKRAEIEGAVEARISL